MNPFSPNQVTRHSIRPQKYTHVVSRSKTLKNPAQRQVLLLPQKYNSKLNLFAHQVAKVYGTALLPLQFHIIVPNMPASVTSFKCKEK